MSFCEGVAWSLFSFLETKRGRIGMKTEEGNMG